MGPYRYTLVILALTLVWAASARSAQPLVVGVEHLNYAPYYYVVNGEYRGYARDLLDAFGAKHGYDFTYVPLPVKRLYHEFLDTKSVDFKFPDNSLWRQEVRKGVPIVYSNPMGEYTDGILVRPGNKGKGLAALKVLGIIMGFDPWRHTKEIDRDSIEISRNYSISGLLGKGLLERVDGVYANVAVARHQLERMGVPGQLVFDPGLPHNTGAYRMSTILRPKVMQQFNAFLENNPELIERIKREHGVSLQGDLSH